jgi:hypothetical protein
MASSPGARTSASNVAKAGVNLFKKFVYDNYQEEPREQRQVEREKAIGEVHIRVLDGAAQAGLELRAFVRDASRAGCGLWCRQPLPVGTMIMVSGAAGQTKDLPQRVARVRHCRGTAGTGFAIGVQFNSEIK